MTIDSVRTMEAIAVVVGGALVVPGAAYGWYRHLLYDAAGLAPAAVLSEAEVSHAVGATVTARRLGRYCALDSRQRLVKVSITSGRTARLRMRVRRVRGSRLVGVGDEAYAGETWVAGRRGDVVILVSQPRDVYWGIPGGLTWLLGTALRRLPDRP